MSTFKNGLNADMTRRRLLGGAVAVAVAPALAKASPKVTRVPKASANVALQSMMSRCQHASVALPGGLLLVCGGLSKIGESQALASTQIYDPYQDIWQTVAPMNMGRARHSAVLLPDGRVAVFGGIGRMLLSSVEIYDPGSNTWQLAAPMRSRRADHSVQVIEGVAFITGGISGTDQSTQTMGMEIYRFRQDRRA